MSIKAGEAFIQTSLRGGDGVKRKLAAIVGRLKSVAKAGARFAAVGLAAAAATLGALAISAAKAGDVIHKMSIRTGIGAEALSQFAFAAEQSGSNLDTFEKGVRKMQSSIVDANMGLSTQVDAMEALGVNSQALAALSPELQFEAMAQAISQVEDPTMRSALAMDIFGRAGAELLPMLSSGAAGLKTMRTEADELGRTMSGEQAQAAADFTDALNRLVSIVKGLAFDIGSSLLPVLTSWMTDLQAAMVVIQDMELSVGGLDDATGNYSDTLAESASPIEMIVSLLGKLAGAYRKAQSWASFWMEGELTVLESMAKVADVVTFGLTPLDKAVETLDAMRLAVRQLKEEQRTASKQNFQMSDDFIRKMRTARADIEAKRNAAAVTATALAYWDAAAPPAATPAAANKVADSIKESAAPARMSNVGTFAGQAIEQLAISQGVQAKKTNELLEENHRDNLKMIEIMGDSAEFD